MREERRQQTDVGYPTNPQSSVSSPRSFTSVSSPYKYKFQKLKVYQLALEYLERIYKISAAFPRAEQHNLKSQIERAATSIVLNIAEGSTGQSDQEQTRFVIMALRSYLETIACLDIAQRHNYISDVDLEAIRASGYELFIKLQAFRRSLSSPRSSVLGPRSSDPRSSVPGLRSSL